MKHYVGMDLHSNNTYIGMIDEKDTRVMKGRFPNDINVILNVLQLHKDTITGIVVESTYNWYWLVDGLINAGYRVHLANPGAITQYNGLKYAGDKHSAFFLAKLLLLNILPEGYIFPPEDRHLRDLGRKRLWLVRQRTTNILSFQSTVSRNLGLSISGNEVKKIKEHQVGSLFENEHLIMAATTNITLMNQLDSHIKHLESELIRKASPKPQFEILKTVPGIGKVIALTIALETGDINRFPTVGKYASYCRCVESKRTSNNKKKGSNNRKNGNKFLSWAYMEAAIMMKRYCPQAKAFFNRKAARSNKILAAKALAHKIARACYYIMRDQCEFDVSKIFGKPLKLNDKAAAVNQSEDLDQQPMAPIGMTAAATNLT